MRHKRFFKFLCTIMLFIYGSVSAQAGQVITKDERDWAKEISSQESQFLDTSSSKSVAVLNFHNKTGNQELNALQKGIAFMLITDLSKVDDLVVVERIRMQALLDELDLGASGLVDRETAPEVGKFLKAYYVVNGNINNSSMVGDVQLASYLLDVPFESISEIPTADGSLDDLFRMEKEILFNIIESLNVYISPAKKAELQKPLSISTAALLFLFQGLDFSDSGMYEKASVMYKRAIAEDPSLEAARNVLQELTDMGLTEDMDLTQKDQVPEEAVKSGGSGTGTAVAVILLGGALAAGIAAGSSSSSSNDGGSPDVNTGGDTDGDTEEETENDTVEIIPPQTIPDDTTPPTASITNISPNGSAIDCNANSNTVVFEFSEPVYVSTGAISVTPSDFFGSVQRSPNTLTTTMNVTLGSLQNQLCLIPGSSTNTFTEVILTLQGFRDDSANQNEMGLTRYRIPAITTFTIN